MNTFPFHYFFFFIWSCTSSPKDLKGLRKYYRLQVQLAYLVDFVQILPWFTPHFPFLLFNLDLHSLELLFIRVCLHLFFFYMVPLAGRTLKGLENTRGKACIFNQLCPIFITVCFEFYFFKIPFSLTLH